VVQQERLIYVRPLRIPHGRALLKKHFGVDLPSELARRDVWPGYMSTFIRRHENADVGDDAVPPREALVGSFGLIPHWSKDIKIARHTYNARSETVAEKPSFRDAWKRGQHCIIPVQSFFEPDWRSGKAVPTRITLTNEEPMGVAGLWAKWRSPEGERDGAQLHDADDQRRRAPADAQLSQAARRETYDRHRAA
jgi:putative SOS response-associated peptidase YedK